MLNLTFIGVRKGTFTSDCNTVTAQWGQDGEFNQSFPAVGKLAHAFVGCAGVAVGQIMHYYKHPAKYDWASMPDREGNKIVSDFLYDLVKDASPNYKETSTGVDKDDMNKMFTKNGYTTQYKSKHASFDCAIPFIVGTHMKDVSGEVHKHAWIVIGKSLIQWDDSMELWTFTQEYDFNVPYGETYGSNSYTAYYVNWGYGGENNGYYTNLNTAYPPVAFVESPYQSRTFVRLKVFV